MSAATYLELLQYAVLQRYRCVRGDLLLWLPGYMGSEVPRLCLLTERWIVVGAHGSPEKHLSRSSRSSSPVRDGLIPGRWDHWVLLTAVQAPAAQASTASHHHHHHLLPLPLPLPHLYFSRLSQHWECQRLLGLCGRPYPPRFLWWALSSSHSALFTLAVLLQRFSAF